MKKSNQPTPEAQLNRTGKKLTAHRHSVPPDEMAVALPRKKPAATKKPKAPANTGDKARRSPRTASASDRNKLVCRYCNSDDLAPSFIKRHDARCRACFKQRYGSAARGTPLHQAGSAD